MRTSWLTGIVLFLLLLVPMPGFAAQAEGGWGWLETAGRWVNLLILFGGIYYLVRKPAALFFRERRKEIQVSIAEAARAKTEAESELAQIQSRVASLDQELASIRAEAEREARQEGERILEQAELEAEKILAQARREIEGVSRAARNELKGYAAHLAVQLAEEKIKRKMDSGREQALAERFLSDLKGRSARGR